MADQVTGTFGVPRDKIHVVPNGVDASKFDKKVEYAAVKRRYAGPNEVIVLFVGRLVAEKGIHVLIGAAPKVLSILPNVKFIIVGEGGMKENLLKETWDFGISHKVFFTGFLDCESLYSLYRCADVCVVPSLYEPFGITALEAMAARVPVVVSDTGGLSEIVEHDKTGVKTFPNNSDSLAWGITRILLDPSYAEMIKEMAYEEVLKKYDWNHIGEETRALYERVHEECQKGSWRSV